MAGLKRKAVSSHTISKPQSRKKVKNEASTTTKPTRAPQILETETDSDPIVESDTTEESGDDDGVSWPSDDEPAAQDSFANDEGGVPLSTTASKASGKIPPQASSDKIVLIRMVSLSFVI